MPARGNGILGLDGKQALFRKNYDKAMTYFDKAVSQDINYTSAWVNRGNTQRAQKNYIGL